MESCPSPASSSAGLSEKQRGEFCARSPVGTLFRGDIRPGSPGRGSAVRGAQPGAVVCGGGFDDARLAGPDGLPGQIALKNPLILVTTPFESVMVLSWIVAMIGLYLIVRSPKPVAVGIFVLPLVLGLVVVAGVCAPPVGLAGLGRQDRILGHGARRVPTGRRRLGVRGVLCGTYVPGADAAAEGEASVAHRDGAAQPRAIGTDQPRGDHGRVSAALIRALDRHGAQPDTRSATTGLEPAHSLRGPIPRWSVRS